MRKKLLSFLKCPNIQLANLKIYGFEVLRKNKILSNLTEEEMLDEDDIVSGILINEVSKIIYPIDQSIAILLSFNDADPIHHNGILKSILEKCPDQYKEPVSQTLQNINRPISTSES